jgi:hypothetical protein
MADSTPLATVIFKVDEDEYLATLWHSKDRQPIWIVRGHGKVWYLPPGGDPGEGSSKVKQRFTDHLSSLERERLAGHEEEGGEG